MPDTRPGLFIGRGGICSACKAHDYKKTIDWAERKNSFEGIVSSIKKRDSGYDCVVPVSGGKDSTWQVIKCIEYGLHILAVTWKTPARTELGQKNLDNLIRLGVDHIDYSINLNVEKRFMYKALIKTGSTALPMHMALYTIPIKVAVNFVIPLVVWGESPHLEYGGDESDWECNSLDHAWFERHGILQGTSAADWVDVELPRKSLEPYFFPSEAEFKKKKVKSIFLGYYFPWDPQESFRVAQQHGFRARRQGARIGFYNYADIDCNFISVHHYFKWIKFGFTRLFDNLSIEIRNERMTRKEAINIIAKTGPQVPYGDIRELCLFLNIPLKHFHEIEEKFRNRKIWLRKNGKWIIKDFIVPSWEW